MQQSTRENHQFADHFLTRRYLIALTAIALLAICGQVLVQFALVQQSGDARVINIAGRQRMLSQKLSKASLAIEVATTATERVRRTKELETVIGLWSTSHEGLQQGSEKLSLSGNNSPEIRDLFGKIQPLFETMLSAARCVISINTQVVPDTETPCGTEIMPHITRILDNEASFLEGMDRIVFQYDAEATTRVERLKIIEMTLLTITLMVLVLEALLIFRPAIRQIKQVMSELLKTRDELQESHKELEVRMAETQSARERAENADKVKSAFMASMSHELRTPLNAVINFTKFVADGTIGPVNEEQVDLLREVIDSAKHLLGLINDVLDMSKIEAGSLKLFIEENVNLSAILDSVVTTGKSLLDDKPVAIESDIDPNLPAIRADRQRVYQILLNIMSNACKFTDDGKIYVRAHREGDDIKIAIQDSGPGIDPKDHEAVFQAFKQTEAGLRKGGGTGLGMPISKNLTEAQGGCLWLESKQGDGATFFVTLPIKSEQLVPVNFKMEFAR
jgi:signal transduction histidine kinase